MQLAISKYLSAMILWPGGARLWGWWGTWGGTWRGTTTLRSAPSLASVLRNLKFYTGLLNVWRFARIVTSVITLNLVTFGEIVVDCVGDEDSKDFEHEQSQLVVAEQFNIPATIFWQGHCNVLSCYNVTMFIKCSSNGLVTRPREFSQSTDRYQVNAHLRLSIAKISQWGVKNSSQNFVLSDDFWVMTNLVSFGALQNTIHSIVSKTICWSQKSVKSLLKPSCCDCSKSFGFD